MGTRYMVTEKEVVKAGLEIRKEFRLVEEYDCEDNVIGHVHIEIRHCSIGGWDFSSHSHRYFIGPNVGKMAVGNDLKEKGIRWTTC
jgi:hypothetical protein